MLEIKDGVITVTQGDTIETSLEMYIDEEMETPYVPSSLDQIWFAVKDKDRPNIEPIFNVQIPVDTMILRAEHEDTEKLPYRKQPYYYDVELITPDGTHKTFISNLLYSTREVHK